VENQKDLYPGYINNEFYTSINMIMFTLRISKR